MSQSVDQQPKMQAGQPAGVEELAGWLTAGPDFEPQKNTATSHANATALRRMPGRGRS